jgi:hypothetical protein
MEPTRDIHRSATDRFITPVFRHPLHKTIIFSQIIVN